MNEGRPPIPTEIKIQRGTNQPSRTNAAEMKPDKLKTIPTAPDWLNDYGKDEWYIVVEHLMKLKILAVIDLGLLAMYCQQVGTYQKAQRILNTQGYTVESPNGYEMPSPWVAIGNKALDQAAKLGIQFGLTPSSRTRIPQPKEKAENPFKALKHGRND